MTIKIEEHPAAGSKWKNRSGREVTVIGVLTKRSETIVKYQYAPTRTGEQPEQSMNLDAWRRIFATKVG